MLDSSEVQEDYNGLFDDFRDSVKRFSVDAKVSSQIKNNMINDMFYCERKLVESIISAEQVEAIVRRANSELRDADIEKKSQEILLFDLEEKCKSFNLGTGETKKI